MAVPFGRYKEALLKEFAAYYEQMPYDITSQQRKMDEMYEDVKSPYPYEKKAVVYKGAAELCDVKVFPGSPYFYELVSGRERNTSQNGYPPGPGLEGWYTRKTQDYMDRFGEWIHPYQEEDLIWGAVFTDMAHHTMGYEKVLRLGLKGIYDQAEMYLHSCTDERKKAFYRSVQTMCLSLKQIAENFAIEAERLQKEETNRDYICSLQELSEAAKRVPWEAASGFYEALCVILFMKEMAIDLEGMAVAVLGHLDRILLPYYEEDVKNGRLTYEQAKNYMAHWLVHTDARWDLQGFDFASTNCSLTIGGCDSDGNIIWNDVSRMILACYEEYGFVNPKIQARMSLKHPGEYFSLCGKMIAEGKNVFSILNDDVLIEAGVRMGKRLEDARLYSAGGCQEPVLDNKELNCRAFIYISLPQIVNSIWDKELQQFFEKEDTGLSFADNLESFEDVYGNFIDRLSCIYKRVVKKVNEFEAFAVEYNPCMMISATLDGCIERGLDMEEGGTKYNPTSIPLVGIGTAVNSLLAIKEVVFNKKMMTLRELGDVLKKDFEGEQKIQDFLGNRCPKLGDDNDKTNAFAARFFADVARVTSGYKNARGGTYEASLFVFYLFDWMKNNLGATPDGRKAGISMSRGINPTEQSGISNVSNILSTIRDLDLSDYPGCAVTYLEMPIGKDKTDPEQIEETIRGFLRVGGSALDLNLLDAETLKKAKDDPEQYKNIIVRVCGFSAYFTSLDPDIQDEIIGRTFVNV